MKYFLTITTFLFFSFLLKSQNIHFQLDTVCVTTPESATLNLKTANFQNIASFQLALKWNPSVVQLDSIHQIELPNTLVFNKIDEEGLLKLSWFAANGTGASLDDEAVLLELDFKQLVAQDTTLVIHFDSTNFDFEAWQFNTTVAQELEIITADGQLFFKDELPQLGLPTDTSFCANSSINIAANCPTCNDFNWNTGQVSHELTADSSGLYIATAIDENNCQLSDSIFIETQTLVVAQLLAENKTLCLGDTIQLFASGGDEYTWIDTSATLQLMDDKTAVIAPLVNTTYQVIVADECSQDTTEVSIEVFTNSITAGQDTCIAVGTEAQLQAQNAVQYQWLPSEFSVSNDQIPNPTTAPTSDALYILETIDSNACIILDTVQVFVATNPRLAIQAINLITPNGDGINDILEFKNLGKFRENTLNIFNRHGVIVYHRRNYQSNEERWDGTDQKTGKRLPTGVYFYILNINGEEILQTINLIR